MHVVSLKQECKIKHCVGVLRRGVQRLAQAFDGGFWLGLLVQQVRKVVPGLCKHRISASRGTQSRFRFNFPAVGPKHVAEIERWRCIGGIAFHYEAVEALGFGNVAGVLCRLCPLKQSIRVLIRSDPQISLPVHQIALVVNGVHLLENLKLDELLSKNVQEFAFIMAVLKIPGATGSTVSPIAVH